LITTTGLLTFNSMKCRRFDHAYHQKRNKHPQFFCFILTYHDVVSVCDNVDQHLIGRLSNTLNKQNDPLPVHYRMMSMGMMLPTDFSSSFEWIFSFFFYLKENTTSNRFFFISHPRNHFSVKDRFFLGYIRNKKKRKWTKQNLVFWKKRKKTKMKASLQNRQTCCCC